jgi:hypothetical protein
MNPPTGVASNTYAQNMIIRQPTTAASMFTPPRFPIPETSSRATDSQLDSFSSPGFALPSSQIDTSGILYLSPKFDSSSRPTTSSSAAPSYLPNNAMVYQNMGPPCDGIQGPRTCAPNSEAGNGVVNQTIVNRLSAPDSSPPSSSLNDSQRVILPPPPFITAQNSPRTAASSVSNPNLHKDDNPSSRDLFLASLRETPSLYNLPRAELEKLVGLVVREEGFAKLVRWASRVYLQFIG